MMTTFPAKPNAVTPLTTAYEWELLFAAAGIWDGINGNDLAPSIDVPSHTITLQPGTVVIKGQVWHTDVTVPLTITLNNSTLPQIDTLVFQYDRGSTNGPTIIQPMIVYGNPAQSPVPQPLVQTAAGAAGTGVWQIPVAQWTAAPNSGPVSGLIDTRQLSGRTTATMFSTARPTMTYSRLGIEIDTGYLVLYDQNIPGWRNIGPKNQVLTSGNFVNGTATAGSDLHTPFTIPANDVNNATQGVVGYRLRAGGGGHQSAKAVATFVFMTNAFGLNWGATSSGQIIQVGGAFNWHYDVELVVKNDGSGSVYGDLTITQGVANPQNQQSVYVLNHQQSANTVNIAAGGPMSIKAYVSATDSTTAQNSPPSLQCVGATFERISN